MVMRQVISEMRYLYTHAEKHIFELLQGDRAPIYYTHRAGWSKVFRSRCSVSLFIDGSGANSYATNIIIPITEEARAIYEELAKELIRCRLPLLTQFQFVKLRCRRSLNDPSPLVIEGIVQHLPPGEILSDAIGYATPHSIEGVYRAISDMELFMRRSRLRFKLLHIQDLIYGKDGRLYPFRYEDLIFDCDRGDSEPLMECKMLREEIKEFGGYAPLKVNYTPDVAAYDETLCDVYGGYISCREMHEGLIAVEDFAGWGFVDELGRVVIEPQYLSVGDFEDGRAVVQLMGSEKSVEIDVTGKLLTLREV